MSFVPRLKVYENGQRTGGEGQGGRAFLAMRVGAGAVQVGSFCLYDETTAGLNWVIKSDAKIIDCS